MNLPTTKPNDRDLDWYIKECEWMYTELGKLKTVNQIMLNRLNSLVSNNNKQTDEYICVDREHGLWKRKGPKEPNVNADRLALALSLETIQELEAENAELRNDKARLDWLEDNLHTLWASGLRCNESPAVEISAKSGRFEAESIRAAIDAARKEAQP